MKSAILILPILFLGVSSSAKIQPVQNSPVILNQLVQEAALKTGLAELESIRADASEWTDKFLSNLRDAMLVLGFDRVPLPGIHQSFVKEIFWIDWHGEFTLKDGSFSGIETIRRTGLATLTYEDGIIRVEFEGGCTSPSLGYSGSAKFMGLGPSMTVTGALSQVQINFAISFHLTPEPMVVLEQLKVLELGSLSLDIKGLGSILNYISEIIFEAVGGVVKDLVGALIVGPIKDLVNEILQSIAFPEFPAKVESIRQILIREDISSPKAIPIKAPSIAIH